MRKFLFVALLVWAVTLPASAEQPAAEQYRQMFASGNFYVEYHVMGTRFLTHSESPCADMSVVMKSERKPFRILYNPKKQFHIIHAGHNGERISKTGIKDKYPDALYRGGKY